MLLHRQFARDGMLFIMFTKELYGRNNITTARLFGKSLIIFVLIFFFSKMPSQPSSGENESVWWSVNCVVFVIEDLVYNYLFCIWMMMMVIFKKSDKSEPAYTCITHIQLSYLHIVACCCKWLTDGLCNARDDTSVLAK